MTAISSDAARQIMTDWQAQYGGGAGGGFLSQTDPRIQGQGAPVATDPAGDWFAQQPPPQGGGYTGPDIAGGGWMGGGQIGSGGQIGVPGFAGGFYDPRTGQPVPAAPSGPLATSGSGGADTSWWNPQDPKGSIDRLFGGQPPSSQTILAHAPQLQAAGIQISPPNAEGVTSKINIPGVGWTRILEGGTAGGQGTGWNYVPQGNTGPGGSILMGGGSSGLGALAGGLDPSAAGRLGYSGGLGLNVDVTQDPSYQFRLQEGQKALERGAAAKGTLLTGGTAKALARYGQDYASTEYGNVYNRALGENQAAYGRLFGEQQNRNNQLLGLSQLGLGAAGQQANLGSAYGAQAGNILNSQATNLSDLVTGAGNARAAGTLAQGNAWAQGLSGATNAGMNALQMYYLNRLYGGGGGGGSVAPSGAYGPYGAGYGNLTTQAAVPPYLAG